MSLLGKIDRYKAAIDGTYTGTVYFKIAVEPT